MTKKDDSIINDFTQGNISLQLFRFAFPSAMSYALQVLYSIVDMMIVGRVLGSSGLSAVSTASQIITILMTICIGFSIGGQIYISQLVGSKKFAHITPAVTNLCFLEIILGLIASFVGMVFCVPALHILSTPSDSFEMAREYLAVASVGMIFTYCYNVLAAILRGMGDSKHPFIFIMIASLINLALDSLFVIYCNMETFGASLATVLSQLISVICEIYFLYRNRIQFNFTVSRDCIRIDRKIIHDLTKLSIPFAIECTAINFSMVFVNKLVNTCGVIPSAVFGVGVKIEDIGNKINTAVTTSCAVMVGQNFSAGNIKRVHHTVWSGWLVAGLFYLIFASICLLFPKDLFSIFTKDSQVLSMAPMFMSALSFEFVAMPMMRGTNGLIQGVGNSKLSLCISLFDGFVARIGLCVLLGDILGYGIYGYFVGYAAAANATSLLGLAYYISGKWKKRDVLV